MIKTLFTSLALAFQNIRSHFFHTLLSVLGIVIGVAALVATLSLIDGMERFARDQISRTTSLKAVTINTQTSLRKNGVSVRKDSFQVFTYAHYQQLKTACSKPAKFYMLHRQTRVIEKPMDTLKIGTQFTGIAYLDTAGHLKAGRYFSANELNEGQAVVLITEPLAKLLSATQPISTLIDETIIIDQEPFRVIGIVHLPQADQHEVFYPITRVSAAALRANPPQVVIEAENVEDVAALKLEIESHLERVFGTKNDFVVASNEFRVAQAARGFKLFRIIMGLIVGISVLVGGIGVMNVLLISVTERTNEIGIRKAVGATARDIVLQFLSESVTISLFGSLVGLALGIAGTLVFVPIIKAVAEVPFQAAYTWNTFFVIAVLAVVVGVVFGTYPAIRASRLDPVEAIRRE
jgi:putative ABC transport system permease protein